MMSNGNIDITSIINHDLMYYEDIIFMSSITFSF